MQTVNLLFPPTVQIRMHFLYCFRHPLVYMFFCDYEYDFLPYINEWKLTAACNRRKNISKELNLHSLHWKIMSKL